ncbi:MAG: hypothetical protein WCW47_03465 [Candidatus Paceibacterota bacterium]|jgi:hypothetical protein
MADEKKPEVKPAEPSWFAHPDPFVEIVWAIVTIFIILYLLNGFVLLVGSREAYFFGQGADLQKSATSLFWKIFTYIEYIAILLSLLLVPSIISLWRKIGNLRAEEAKKFYIEKSEPLGTNNPHWEKILKNIESMNESDWRLAILEADIMLDTLLDNLGFLGETMADKLKAVERSDFATIDNAWEAHKIRNQIAHEGGVFELNQQEAKRVIGLYQSVFEEFRII